MISQLEQLSTVRNTEGVHRKIGHQSILRASPLQSEVVVRQRLRDLVRKDEDHFPATTQCWTCVRRKDYCSSLAAGLQLRTRAHGS